MKFRVTKDTKFSKEGKETLVVFPPAGNKETDEFAEQFVRMHEASVREFEDEASLKSFLADKFGTADVFTYVGNKSLRSIASPDDVGEAMFNAPEAPVPKNRLSGNAEAIRVLRLAKGIIEDIGRCKYGVSIASLSAEANAYVDEAIERLTKAEGGDAK